MTEAPESESAMRPGARGALVVIALLTALVSLRTIANADFWLHLAGGREVSEHGFSRLDPFSIATGENTPWLQVSWLYDWLLYGAWRLGHAPLVVAAHALLAGGAFALMLAMGRQRSRAGLLAGLLAVWLAAPQLVVRPALPAFLFAALTAWTVQQPWPVRRLLAWLIPVQLLWSNMHLSFLLGPLLALLAAVEAHLTSRSATAAAGAGAGARIRTRNLLWTAGILLAVSVINPYGLRTHLEALREFVRPSEGWLLEWISPFASLFDQGWFRVIPSLVLILIVLGFVLHRPRLPWFASVLGIVSAFFIVGRTHPNFRTPLYGDWCALLALPFLALSAEALLDFIGRMIPEPKRARARRVAAGIGLAAVLASGWSFASSAYYRDGGSAARFGWGVESSLFPFEVSRSLLTTTGFPARIYNLPLDGGALLWARPGQKILVDARTQVYGTPFLRDLNLALMGDQDRRNALTRRWPADAFVFNCCWSSSGSMIRNLLVSRQWSLVYFDGSAAVLMPALRKNLAWFRNRSLQQAGLDLLEQERQTYASAVRRGEHPVNPPRLIGGASFLQSVGMFREASSLYSLLARGTPHMTGAWLNLGICLVQQGDPAQAIPVLEYMRSRLPKHVMVHLWLSRAYRETGRADEADTSFAKAMAMDRAVSEAFIGLTRTNTLSNTLLDGGRSIR